MGRWLAEAHPINSAGVDLRQELDLKQGWCGRREESRPSIFHPHHGSFCLPPVALWRVRRDTMTPNTPDALSTWNGRKLIFPFIR